MRVLVVTNMYPAPDNPVRGHFVAAQVAALRKLAVADVEVFSFPPGLRSYPRAAADLRRRFRGVRFDVVHAHFGLSAWPALAIRARARMATLHGTDLHHPRSRALTAVVLPTLDVAATVSRGLATELPWTPGGTRISVLPMGVDLTRFVPIDRREARRRLGLDPDGRYLLFPADPARQVKRYDRARAVAGDVRLLALGAVPPDQVPLWINAANAVLVTSDAEGFGLAIVEALACDVPVFSTPVGIARPVLDGVAGTYCGEFDIATWRRALSPHLTATDPRVSGRVRAEPFSTERMAARVAAVWRALI